MLEYSARKNVGLAVGSIVAAASIGTAMAVYISPGTLGRISFGNCYLDKEVGKIKPKTCRCRD